MSFRTQDGWCFSNEQLFNIWFSPPFAACGSRDIIQALLRIQNYSFLCKLFFFFPRSAPCLIPLCFTNVILQDPGEEERGEMESRAKKPHSTNVRRTDLISDVRLAK